MIYLRIINDRNALYARKKFLLMKSKGVKSFNRHKSIRHFQFKSFQAAINEKLHEKEKKSIRKFFVTFQRLCKRR